MHVKRLKLENFRGIRSLDLTFDTNSNVVVLVGINGIGKSSILDAIAGLLTYFGTNGRWGYSKYYTPQKDIRFGKNASVNELTILTENGEDFNWHIAIYQNGGRADTFTINKIKYFKANRYNEVYSVYYLSNRDVQDLMLVDLSNNLLSPRHSSNSNLEFSDLTYWFKNTEDIENEERLNRDISYRDRNLEAVRNAVYSILGSEFKNLKFKRTAEKMTIEKQSLEIAVDWLSDGEKSLLAMVADLAKRLSANNPNSTNPLEETGIVLIDEVELHLHPAWQRKIIPQLTKTFPNCQFIVTTHSPQILSHVQPESIYLLKKDGEEIIVDRPQYSYGRDSNRILEDLMEQPERPQEIQDLLSHLFALIHDGELDSAKALLEEISDKIGSSEPELSKAAVAIKRKEIIGR